MPKTIDVIIPICKPNKSFNNIVGRLFSQTKKINNVILLQTLEDQEKILINKDKRVKIIPIRKESFNHGLTRKRGVKYSQADIVIFMTQDAVPKDKYLVEELIGPFEKDASVAISYARQEANSSASLIETYTREFNYPPKDVMKSSKSVATMGIKTYFVSNSCAAYERKIYDKLGGFENVIFAEDMMYAIKAINSGYKIAYTSKACVIHSHNTSLKDQFKRNFDIGVLHKQHQSIFSNISSESEGLKMVKNIMIRLIRRGHIREAFYYLMLCAAKYTGYKVGKNYDLLSKQMILRLTLNKGFWK
ncbi:MAG TPA: glycosyltransferase family 2 protein [Candidatus Dorea intestinavium]|nr:glycosyltransferase family 2 protein [Candidatus Dorea intestinavium]